jgi:hypothetical protein
MKKVLLSIAFLLIAQISIAQDASFKADVLKMISLSGSDAQKIIATSTFVKVIPEADRAEFTKVYEAALPGFYNKMAIIYMETYTHEDIKGIIAFYESPLGKRMNKNTAVIAEKSMKAAQEMAQEMFGIIKKYEKGSAVRDPTNVSDNIIYSTAGIEVKPDFPGGRDEFYKFIAKNYRTPDVKKLNGKIYITFVIEKDGSLTEIKAIKDIGYGTGEEGVRVLGLSPKWLPGEQNGQKVRCTYSLPISIMGK